MPSNTHASDGEGTEAMNEVELARGSFRVVRGAAGFVATLAMQTPLGPVSLVLDLGGAQGHATGRVNGPLPVPCFDVLVKSMDYVAQSAISSGTSLAAGQADALDKARMQRLVRAHLGDQGALAEVSAILHQASVSRDPRVRYEADAYARLARDQKDKLARATGPVKRMREYLARGDYDGFTKRLGEHFAHRFRPSPEVDAKYTTGGAPMRISHYRAMTGCSCDNPCVECRCLDSDCCPC